MIFSDFINEATLPSVSFAFQTNGALGIAIAYITDENGTKSYKFEMSREDVYKFGKRYQAILQIKKPQVPIRSLLFKLLNDIKNINKQPDKQGFLF